MRLDQAINAKPIPLQKVFTLQTWTAFTQGKAPSFKVSSIRSGLP